MHLHGDPIEKIAARKLNSSVIGAYEKYWGKYIGNKGGIPVDIPEISEELDVHRKRIGQWFYSILTNALIVFEVKNYFENWQRGKHITDIQMVNELFNAYYNSSELCRKYNEWYKKGECRGEEIRCQIRATYKTMRNAMVHGIRPWFYSSEEELRLVDPERIEEFRFDEAEGKEIDDFWIWSDYKVKPSFDQNYITATNMAVFVENQIHQMIYQYSQSAANMMASKLEGLTISDPEEAVIKHMELPISQSASVVPNASGDVTSILLNSDVSSKFKSRKTKE